MEPKVFISYSHDNASHKDWVLQLATRLRSNGVDVLLDRWNLNLGSDLPKFMEHGLSKSHRIICICSDDYVTKSNDHVGGVGYEKLIMTGILFNDLNSNWIIPIIKNYTKNKKVPHFLGSKVYISFEDSKLYEKNYEILLREILEQPILPIPLIGKNPFKTIRNFSQQKFISQNEKYVSPSTQGVITFDYSNNNGKYYIGQNELMFEIAFSKASNTSIYLYNDPESIHAIALVKDADKLNLITDARKYDYSSRTRCPTINQIVLLQNSFGFYAAIKILSIKDDLRGAKFDEITLEYAIQTNGTPDFTSLLIENS